MEFSTKTDRHTPENEAAGIGARDTRSLYNKNLQNLYIKGTNTQISPEMALEFNFETERK